jgi:hypothetical protein
MGEGEYKVLGFIMRTDSAFELILVVKTIVYALVHPILKYDSIVRNMQTSTNTYLI